MTKFDDLRVLTRALAFRLIVGTMHSLPILGFSVLRMHSVVMFGTKFCIFPGNVLGISVVAPSNQTYLLQRCGR